MQALAGQARLKWGARGWSVSVLDLRSPEIVTLVRRALAQLLCRCQAFLKAVAEHSIHEGYGIELFHESSPWVASTTSDSGSAMAFGHCTNLTPVQNSILCIYPSVQFSRFDFLGLIFWRHPVTQPSS